MSFGPGHLSEHPLPPGIVGALGLAATSCSSTSAESARADSGRTRSCWSRPSPTRRYRTPGTQISLHQPRLKDEREASAFTQLAAQLGYLRLSGYRLALERAGLRSKVNLVNPATGAIVAMIPDKQPGRLFGGGANAASLLATVRGLPPAGPPPDLQSPELLRQVLLALALRDESLGGAEAAELADRALELTRQSGGMDPPAALEAAKQDRGA